MSDVILGECSDISDTDQLTIFITMQSNQLQLRSLPMPLRKPIDRVWKQALEIIDMKKYKSYIKVL